MSKYIFKMECVTNMHVGSGDANYNIIDNEVQKDVVLTDVPAIHSSGVKGALREHFENKSNISAENINRIFGSKSGESTQGEYKFFSAKLIARPLRTSEGKKPYLLATSNDILKDFSDFLEGLGLKEFFSFLEIEIPAEEFFVATSDVSALEGLKVTEQSIPSLEKIIGNDYAITNTLRYFDLPVMARNKIKDETDGNLWYEEIVPHKSIFYFVIITPNYEENLLNFDGEAIQFGGNASIGQGYTKITQVYPKKEEAIK